MSHFLATVTETTETTENGAHTLGHRTVMPLAWNARWLVIPINQLLAPACLQSEELATPRSLSCAALGFLPLLF